jgi:hypothetical protein
VAADWQWHQNKAPPSQQQQLLAPVQQQLCNSAVSPTSSYAQVAPATDMVQAIFKVGGCGELLQLP